MLFSLLSLVLPKPTLHWAARVVWIRWNRDHVTSLLKIFPGLCYYSKIQIPIPPESGPAYFSDSKFWHCFLLPVDHGQIPWSPWASVSLSVNWGVLSCDWSMWSTHPCFSLCLPLVMKDCSPVHFLPSPIYLLLSSATIFDTLSYAASYYSSITLYAWVMTSQGGWGQTAIFLYLLGFPPKDLGQSRAHSKHTVNQ